MNTLPTANLASHMSSILLYTSLFWISFLFQSLNILSRWFLKMCLKTNSNSLILNTFCNLVYEYLYIAVFTCSTFATILSSNGYLFVDLKEDRIMMNWVILFRLGMSPNSLKHVDLNPSKIIKAFECLYLFFVIAGLSFLNSWR